MVNTWDPGAIPQTTPSGWCLVFPLLSVSQTLATSFYSSWFVISCFVLEAFFACQKGASVPGGAPARHRQPAEGEVTGRQQGRAQGTPC